MITALYMGSRAPNGTWHPIKKMTWTDTEYRTVWLQGIHAAAAVDEVERASIARGEYQLDRLKITEDLPVEYRVRMAVNRDFDDTDMLDRLGLSTDLSQFDPFAFAAREGGTKGSRACHQLSQITAAAR